MARRKSLTKSQLVTVRVTRSFGSLYRGEQFATERDEKTQGFIRAGLLREVNDGQSQAGPGVADEDVQRSEPAGTEGGGTAGGEPGEDPRAG